MQEISESERKLRSEYEWLFKERKLLRQSIARALRIARRGKNAKVINLLEVLSHHADIEEHLLYPAALLAGFTARLLLANEAQTIFE
ncbi:MAG: hypothetical protein ACREBS_10440 [Nitrososphaerales archaeon]